MAICEAVTRPDMRFVPVKTTEQQALLMVHRIRERVKSERTALINQVRGLLAEFGLVMPQGASALAAKHARIVWALMAQGTTYQVAQQMTTKPLLRRTA